MSERFQAERIDQSQSDFVLIALMVLLLGLGLSTLFSASYFHGTTFHKVPEPFFYRQLISVGVGGLVAFVLSRISLDLLKSWIPVLVFVTFALTLLTFVPGVGVTVLGARRWINILGFSFQPSELIKFTVVVYLAHIFSKKRDRIDDLVNTIIPPLIVSILFVALVYFQNDFSTAFFVLFLALTMFFVARVPFGYLVFLICTLVPLGGALIFAKQHRVERIISFLDPGKDPLGAGYQVAASQSALIHGGVWGTGLGRGVKKIGQLPEAHSDFIFAVLGEEAGFIGVIFVLALFLAFAVRGYSIGLLCKDRFGYYMAFGFTTSILFQSLLNIAVISGLVPATGIPLPFFSAGGSSILMTLAMCGLLLNLSRRERAGSEEAGR